METKQAKRTGKSWLGLAIVWTVTDLLAFWIGRQMVIREDYALAAGFIVSNAGENTVIAKSGLADDAYKIIRKRLTKSEIAEIFDIYSATGYYKQLVRSYALGTWTGTGWSNAQTIGWVRITEDLVEDMGLISIRYRDKDWEVSMLTIFDPKKYPGLAEYFFQHPFKRAK